MIQDCQAELQKLMFSWMPAVNLLSIKDSLTNSQVGWSFLKELENRLQHSFRYIHHQAWQIGPEGLMANHRWSRAHSIKYLQRVAQFWRLLLVCIYFTGSMPGRIVVGKKVTLWQLLLS
jgi:hypothetical protein